MFRRANPADLLLFVPTSRELPLVNTGLDHACACDDGSKLCSVVVDHKSRFTVEAMGNTINDAVFTVTQSGSS